MDKFQWGNIFGISYIWLVFLALIIIIFGTKRREKIIGTLIETRLIALMIKGNTDNKRFIKSLLLLMTLFFSVISIMEPNYDYTWETVERKGTDIIVALDTSKSMYADDINPSRFLRSRLEIKNMVSCLNGDRIGLVLFTSTALTQCPLTLDYSTFNLFLDEAEIGTIERGGTSLPSAVQQAVKSFDKRYKKERILFIISDGETHDNDLDTAIDEAKKAGIRIFTIGIGSKSVTPVFLPSTDGQKQYLKDKNGEIVKTRLDEEPLKKLALHTGGAYIHGSNSSFSLEKIYKEKIEPLEGRELESKRKKRYENRFYIPLALALLLLLLESFLNEIPFNIASKR